MPIPNLDDIRRPALELLAERGTLTKISEVFDLLAPKFDLTDEDLAEMLPSNTQRKWHNRVNWACYDLFKAGLLDRPTKGHYQINASGQNVLLEGPPQITRKYLAEISESFLKFVTPNQDKGLVIPPQPTLFTESRTPDEQIESAFSQLNESLASELQAQMAKMDPFRFEQLVVDLLFAMGYGGSREEAAKITKKSNDEGIDGVINEDRLGLDVIYVQAKRWQGTVGRKEIQSFVGALAGQQANKGVFITTSEFAQTAIDYAKSVQQKVILIDGTRLAELMIEHNIGVTTARTISLKRIDSDYFEEN
ncbi:MAG: restriction endonuclease [Verrucomicrobiota bacterium]